MCRDYFFLSLSPLASVALASPLATAFSYSVRAFCRSARASIAKELGYAYLKLQDGAAAREAFSEAVRLAPQDPTAALQLAFLERQAGREDQARRLFENVVNMAAGEPSETARRALAEGPADPVYNALERAYAARKQGALDHAVAGALRGHAEAGRLGTMVKARCHASCPSAWLMPPTQLATFSSAW